jgi:hypothetical protein
LMEGELLQVEWSLGLISNWKRGDDGCTFKFQLRSVLLIFTFCFSLSFRGHGFSFGCREFLFWY